MASAKVSVQGVNEPVLVALDKLPEGIMWSNPVRIKYRGRMVTGIVVGFTGNKTYFREK